MANEFLPSKVSPANTFFTHIDRWNDSPSFAKRELATRVYTVFLSIVVGVLSSGLNIAEIMIKAPGVLFKYTFGYIPYHGGKLGDQLPKGFEIDEFLKHIYNVVVFGVMTTIVSPIVGGIDPRASVWIHVKLDVVFPDETSSFSYLFNREVKNTETLPETPASQTPSQRTLSTDETAGNQGVDRGEQNTNDTPPALPPRTASLPASTQQNTQQTTDTTAPSEPQYIPTEPGRGLFTSHPSRPQQRSPQISPRRKPQVQPAAPSDDLLLSGNISHTPIGRMLNSLNRPGANQNVSASTPLRKSEEMVKDSEWKEETNNDFSRNSDQSLSESTPPPSNIRKQEPPSQEIMNPQLFNNVSESVLRRRVAADLQESDESDSDSDSTDFDINVRSDNTQPSPPRDAARPNAKRTKKPAEAKGANVGNLRNKFQQS